MKKAMTNYNEEEDKKEKKFNEIVWKWKPVEGMAM